MNPIRDRVIEIMLRHSRDSKLTPPLDDATPLVGDGLHLDSVDLLEAIVDLEKKLGIVLREEDLTAEALSNIGRFVAHIEQRFSSEKRYQ